MPRLRLMLLGLGLILLAWSTEGTAPVVYAQVVTPMNSNGVGAAMGLNLVERKLVRRITEAEQALASGDQVTAVSHLQFILDLPEDGFFRPADEAPGRFVSLKQQAETLLSKAAPETLRVYEQQHGAAARNAFNAARTRRDPKIAQEVMRKYLYTAAGADAAYWLGSYHLDRADYASALQCLMRLRRLSAAGRFEPQLSLRTALCLFRTGRPDRAQALVREAAAQARGPIQIGGQTLPPGGTDAQVVTWLNALGPNLKKASAEPTGWMMARGNPQRNLHLHSSPPVGKSLWNLPLTAWNVPDSQDLDKEVTLDVSPQMQGLIQIHADKGLTPLPAAAPLLVNQVVVARFYDHLSGFDARTGQEIWRSAESDRIFQLLLKNSQLKEESVRPINNRARTPRELLTLLLRQRTWEDLTFNGLSSDGEYVFMIDDLGVLNDLSIQTGTPQSHPLIMRDYNRLCAYEARTGKLKWELGGPRGDVTLNLPGTFFLGPPLPVDNQLYCLTESQAQTLLMCLDARTGKLLWSQTLSQPVDDLMREPNRRRAGISPALMGDMLICPTGSGLVVAVDVAARSLAWAYQYVAAASNDPRDPRLMRRRMALLGIPQVEMDTMRGAETNEWQDGCPIVAEGYVILTPRDSSDLHCLSLEDGKTAWRMPRKEALYVAAVQNGLVIIVSTRSVEALHLADGTPAWSQPVPLMNQAGRGIVTDNHILLPLVSKEVATIDLKSGRLLSRVKIHDSVGLGNLIPGPGLIITQTADHLAAFRTLDSVSDETTQRLAQNPQDSEALALRGEFRLSQGKLAEGQADLRQSLQLNKVPATQAILFESLLQILQADFAGQRALLPEAEQLAQSPAEFSALYRTWAEGLLAARELVPAFEILLKLSSTDAGAPQLERLDGYRSLRRDQWVRTQLHELFTKIDAATQQQVESELRKRLQAAEADKSPDGLRRFISFFGSHPIGDDARQALVKRLLESEYSIEVEQLLAQLRHSPNPRVAGPALALMIRELIKLQHGEECDQLLTQMTPYHDIVCLDGQTGAQLVATWQPMVQTRVPFARDWPTGKIETSRKALPVRNPSFVYDIFLDGDRGPFYRHWQFKNVQDLMRVVGMNGWGEPGWSLPISELGHNGYLNAYRAQVRNHLVLLTTGSQVVALNTLTEGTSVRAKTMWNSPLVEGSLSEQTPVMHVINNRPGIIRQRAGFDRWQTPVGMANALTDDSVAILRGRHLVLNDLVTGEILWKRTDLVAGSEIFGDDRSLLVIPPDDGGATEIRRSDGFTLGTHPVPPAAARLLNLERSILSVQRDAVQKIMKFQLTDVPAEKLTWEREFPFDSQFSVYTEQEMAVLEPTGQLSLVSLRDGRVAWSKQVQLLPNFKEMWALPDGDRLLVIHGEMPPRNFPQPAMFIGNNQTLIDGQVDCINRSNGDVLWTHRIERFALDYTLPQYLPFWVFSVRTASVQPQNVVKPEFQMQVLDKRSGQVILKTTETSHVGNLQVQIDDREKQVHITLMGGPQPIQHTLKYTNLPIDLEPAPEPPKPK